MKHLISFCTGLILNTVTLFIISPTAQYVVEGEKIHKMPVVIGATLGYTTVENDLLRRYIELDTQIRSNNPIEYNEIFRQKRQILRRLNK